MTTATHTPEAAPTADDTPRRRASDEPIPGYRLVERLGRGGSGEVWRCAAPGGLVKAMKIIAPPPPDTDPTPAAAVPRALERVRAIRHPFLLSPERVERVGGEVLVVTELADSSLRAAAAARRARGEPGVPREELLQHLQEAAEVLDVLNFQYGLPHLGLTPGNLLLRDGHVAVADFGLAPTGAGRPGGPAPRYAAPELFRGEAGRHADQYSLALAYHELLTGVPPFAGESARELMRRRASEPPDLAAAPPGDRPALARALARRPQDRFACCLEFVGMLWEAEGGPGRRGAAVRRRPVLPADPLPEPPAAEPDDVMVRCRFVERLRETPLCQTWAGSFDGEPGRLLQLPSPELLPTTPAGDRALERLLALRHPGLQDRRALRCRSGRVVLVGPAGLTLHDRLRECVRRGRPGVPRNEVLALLGGAADALDAVADRHGVHHLGLNLGNVFVHGCEARLADHGLVALLWLPQGRPAAANNPRYAAPELAAPGDSATADVYSLGLMYAELVTGAHPRGKRGELCLDLLTAPEREVVGRACHPDPRQRYARCGDFVRAFRAGRSRPAAARREPPAVVAAAALGAAVGPPGVAFLSPADYAARLLASQAGEFRTHEGGEAFSYQELPGGVLEHGFAVAGLDPARLAEKLGGFRAEWNARVVERDGAGRVALRIDPPASLWQRLAGRAALRLAVSAGPPAEGGMSRVVARLEAASAGAALPPTARALGPVLFRQLRRGLAAGPERRRENRWACDFPVEVYAVPEAGPVRVVHGRATDLSMRGVRLTASEVSVTDRAYLRTDAVPELAAYAILVKVRRKKALPGGGWGLGATFGG